MQNKLEASPSREDQSFVGSNIHQDQDSGWDFECEATILAEPLPGAKLLDVCTKLRDCGAWQNWPRPLVDQLVRLLAGRAAGIVGHGSAENIAGADRFVEILPDWEAYTDANPWVRPIVDPTYLEIDVSTGPNAAAGRLAAPVMPAPYPPLVAPPGQQLPPLVPVGGGGYSFAFGAGAAGQAQAHHLLGALQALNPGLRGKIYSTGNTPVLYR